MSLHSPFDIFDMVAINIYFYLFSYLILKRLFYYRFSVIIPRPQLKINIYLSYSVESFKGLFLALAPIFLLIFIWLFYFIIKLIKLFFMSVNIKLIYIIKNQKLLNKI